MKRHEEGNAAHRNTMQCRKNDKLEEKVQVIAMSPAGVCSQGSLKPNLEREGRSRLAEIRQDWVNELKGLVDLLTDLGTSKDDLARHEDQEDNSRLHHTVDETREQLRLVGRESVMARCKTLETNGEANVAGADNVLNLEVGELCAKPKLLDNPRVFAGSKAAVIFRLGTGYNHFSTRKDQGRRLRLANTHDHSSETLGVVFGVTGVKSDGLEIKASGQVDSSHDVLESRHDARRHLTVLCIGSSRRRRNTVRIFGDLLSVLLSGRCSQVEVRALGVGERSRSNERLSLCGGGRVRSQGVWIHDEFMIGIGAIDS